MKMPYGKYKGMEMTQLPADYLQWILSNFDEGDIKAEARRILKSPTIKEEQSAKTLEEQANEILGEKPLGNLPRGFGRPRKRK